MDQTAEIIDKKLVFIGVHSRLLVLKTIVTTPLAATQAISYRLLADRMDIGTQCSIVSQCSPV